MRLWRTRRVFDPPRRGARAIGIRKRVLPLHLKDRNDIFECAYNAKGVYERERVRLKNDMRKFFIRVIRRAWYQAR